MKKRRKQTFVSFFSCFIFFTLFSEELQALPKEAKLISGSAEFQEVDFQSLQIKTSDKAILHYGRFDIGKGERVTFLQPSSSSCVLNKVTGSHPSKIFGQLNANGKVFLVNSQGIYFGPNSQVNVGSLIASTLDISQEDFLNENYRFHLGSNRKGLIQNEGFLSAANEGAIVLMAPQIQNLGVIKAKAGQVALLSGEHIVLDFTGDGLIQFSIDGDLKEAVIEHLGHIDAVDGSIFIQLNRAKKAIQEMVNQDGVEEGEVFIEEKGRIHLVSASTLFSKNISVNGGDVFVEGKIDASDKDGVGGSIHLFGEKISLLGSTLDATGAFGGGEVLIGGEFQGTGTTEYSLQVVMDSFSQIKADSLENGDGGLVVLWSQDETVFNGKISARGGALGGSGGLVETSSKGHLQVDKGSVDTMSFSGQYGNWLLDPSELIIGSSTTCDSSISTPPTFGSCCNTSECPNCSISASTVSGSLSNVTLQASSLISVLDSISMSTPGVGLTFMGCVDASPILELSANITTKGGAVIVNSDLNVELMNNILIDTTNGNDVSYLLGADVTMDGLFSSGSNPSGLQINAGSGGRVTVSCSVIGSSSNISYLTIENAGEVFLGQIVTQGDLGFSMPTGVPLFLTGTLASIDTTGGGFFPLGAPITTGTIDGSVSGDQAFSLSAGSGLIEVGTIGGTVPLGDLTIIGTADFSPPNITTDSGKIWIYSPIVLSSSIALDTTGGEIHLFSSVDGSVIGNENLTLTAGTGSIHLDQAIGSHTRIGNLTVTSVGNMTTSAITASSIVQMQGTGVTVFGRALTTTAFGGLDLTGNGFGFVGSVNAGGSGGVRIVNTGPLIISRFADMTLGGSFSQSGGGGVLTAGNLTLSNASSSISFGDPVALTSSVTLQTNNGAAFFESKIIGPGSLTVNAGSADVTFQGSGGVVTSLGGLDVTASHVFLQGAVMKTLGDQSYHAPVVMTHNTTFSSLVGNLTFDSFLDGSSSGTCVIFSMGGGALTLNQVGSIEPLGSISVLNSGSYFAQSTTGTSLEIIGGESTVEFLGSVSLSGDLGLIVDAQLISLGAPITASRVFFRATESILNLSSSKLITILGSSLPNVDYFNAEQGYIGSLESPIEVSTSETLRIGAHFEAHFAGPMESLPFQYISANTPCIMTYNGTVLRDCHLILSAHDLFNTIPKNLFYVPGLYSFWSFDNLSRDWYFYPEAVYPEINSRELSLFALKQESKFKIAPEKLSKKQEKPPLEKVSVSSKKMVSTKENRPKNPLF